MKKIGLVGAPGSGKTVLGARMYANFLEAGISSAKLVPEYALEHLGSGRHISTILDQIDVVNGQIRLEEQAERCNFNPIICDTALWQGAIYFDMMNYQTRDKRVAGQMIEKLCDYMDAYDLTIVTLLYDNIDKVNKFRIHNAQQARQIESAILTACSRVKGKVIFAPTDLRQRDVWAMDVVDNFIKENFNV